MVAHGLRRQVELCRDVSIASTSVRAGLALSALIGLGNLPLLSRDINWGEQTPPYGLLLLAAVVLIMRRDQVPASVID